jgi:hypothetical protein
VKIAIHLGVHCTDEGALLRCLLKNRTVLGAAGVVLPDPERYPVLLREAANALDHPPDTAEAALDLLTEVDDPARIVLSFESFMAFPRWSLGRGQFYPGGTERTLAMSRLFAGTEIEFHLALRNPATYLPALFLRQKGKSYDEFMAGCDPLLLRWSDLVERLRQTTPEAAITLWCDEDTPLIWPEVLAAVAGHRPEGGFAGVHDRLAQIMPEAGHRRMIDYMDQNPPLSETHRRKIVAAFVDKFALPDALEMEIDLPGWNAQTVEAATAAYDEDLALIAQMPGVRFLTP